MIYIFSNSFSDPVVVLDGRRFKATATGEIHIGSVEALTRIGNQGLTMRQHHTCCLCQRVVSDRKNLRNHFEAFHFKSKKRICDHCPKFYYTRNGILQHMRAHGSNFYQCSFCRYTTYNKRSFQDHQRSHAKVQCPRCRAYVGYMDKHMKRHEQDDLMFEKERLLPIPKLSRTIQLPFSAKEVRKVHIRSPPEEYKEEMRR